MMTRPQPASVADFPISRFAAFARLSADDIDILAAAARARRVIASRREFLCEGAPAGEPLIVLSGWAYRSRVLRDGRHQIFGFALPGDLLNLSHHGNAVAPAAVTALTEVQVCPAPQPVTGGIAAAFAARRALEEHYLLRQIARLGRMTARERLVDWLLEIRDRLAASGLTFGDSFALPTTQECIADTLGLTSIHVNRTLQTLRREGLIALRGGTITLCDPERLIAVVDHRPPPTPFA